MLPGGGGALLYPPSVAGEVALVHHGMCHVVQPRVGERLEEILRGKESRVDVPLVVLHYLPAERRAYVVEPVGRDSHAQGVDVAATLAVGLGRRVVERPVESLPEVIRLGGVEGCVVRVPEHPGGTSRVAGAEPAVEGVHKFLARKVGWRAPVAEVEPVGHVVGAVVGLLLEHGALRREPCVHVPHLRLHGIVVGLQRSRVAVLHEVLPWYDAHGCTPCHAASTSGLPWRAVGHVAGLGVLAVAYVPEPFGIERSRIVVEHHGLCRRLSVARVWQSLAVGAVARHAPVHVVGLRTSPDGVDFII